MASVLKFEQRLNDMGAAINTLVLVQSALKKSLQDADTVTIELADTGAAEFPLLRAVITLKPLGDLAEAAFVLRHDLVPDFRFIDVKHHQGAHKRNIITAIIANR
jgi:hypothetical protein